MLAYKDVVKVENRHKVYLCELLSGEYMRLIVAENENDKDFVFFDYDDSKSDKVYEEVDVVEIYHEVEPDQQEEYDDDYEYDKEIDYKTLEKFKTSISDIYFYDSMEELDEIIKALNNPIVSDTGWDNDYKVGLIKSYGLVFYWSEYDDFSCGNPFTHYCKIIDGGSIL